MKQKFNVTGMTCSACSAHIEKSVGALPGVELVQVNLLQNSMQVEYDPDRLKETDIVAAVEKGGYGASPVRPAGEKAGGSTTAAGEMSPAEREEAAMRQRLIWSFAFLIPLLYITMAHMLGAPIPAFLHGGHGAVAYGLTQLLLTIPILIAGQKYYIGGFRALFHRAPNMDSLIAIGSAAAVLYSVWKIYDISYAAAMGQLGHAEMLVMNLYFESAGTILALITLGKYFEARSKGKTSAAIAKLLELAPKTATRLEGGREVEVPIEQIAVGDVIVVRQGQRIPVDGVITEGYASIDQSALTGESIPVDKAPGDHVMAATVSGSGYFLMRAERVGNDTALQQIIALVEDAAASKAPIGRLADRVSGVFVPAVIAIAVLALGIWLAAGQGIAFSLGVAIAVLVISCPCALGLATPTAIMVGTGRGAEMGILVKSAESLETARLIDTVVFDKTGTLTEGRPRVTDVAVLSGEAEEDLLRLAASLEKLSEHPLSEAIVQEAEARGIALLPAVDFVSTPGEGIEGTVAEQKIFAGNEKMMRRLKVDLSAAADTAEALQKAGKTPLYFAQQQTLLGVIAVADGVKDSAPAAVRQLREAGLHVVLLTGDNARTARAVAGSLGIDEVVADVLPGGKDQVVAELQAAGRKVAMVGDGINDAPALTRADLGIAIGTGTDIAIESADMVLLGGDVAGVYRAIMLSRAVIHNVKQNLFWAFFYNVIGIPLAAGALYLPFGLLLSPTFAAAAMSFSSVSVVGNALRLRRWRPHGARASVRPSSPAVQTAPSAERAPAACPLAAPPANKQERENDMNKTIHIEGMSCMHCSGRVEKALTAIPGVTAKVDLDEKLAVVTCPPDVTDEALRAAVEEAGYTVVDIL